MAFSISSKSMWDESEKKKVNIIINININIIDRPGSIYARILNNQELHSVLNMSQYD